MMEENWPDIWIDSSCHRHYRMWIHRIRTSYGTQSAGRWASWKDLGPTTRDLSFRCRWRPITYPFDHHGVKAPIRISPSSTKSFQHYSSVDEWSHPPARGEFVEAHRLREIFEEMLALPVQHLDDECGNAWFRLRLKRRIDSFWRLMRHGCHGLLWSRVNYMTAMAHCRASCAGGLEVVLSRRSEPSFLIWKFSFDGMWNEARNCSSAFVFWYTHVCSVAIRVENWCSGS